jgi:hypothetical protein
MYSNFVLWNTDVAEEKGYWSPERDRISGAIVAQFSDGPRLLCEVAGRTF